MRLHNRQIKADFWRDGELAAWPIAKRAFYLGLIQLTDDSGCIERDAFAMKQHLFALQEEVKLKHVETWIDEMVTAGKLIPYTEDDKSCLYLKNFHRHQSLKNPDAPEAPLPAWITWIPYPSNPRSGKYLVSTPEDILKKSVRSPEEKCKKDVRTSEEDDALRLARPCGEPEPEPFKKERNVLPNAEQGAPQEPDTGRPFVRKFLDQVWTPCFPHRSLVPSTYSLDAKHLNRLENALALFGGTPAGLASLFDYLKHEIGPEGEVEISALRAKVQQESAKANTRWHQNVIAYFAATIEHAHERFTETGTLSGRKPYRTNGRQRPHQAEMPDPNDAYAAQFYQPIWAEEAAKADARQKPQVTA